MTRFANAALPPNSVVVVKSFIDINNKALLRDRPGWTAMLDECGKDGIKTIVIPAFSMLSHNYNDTFSAVKCLKKNGEINTLFLLENSFSATDEGQMQMHLQCFLYDFMENHKDEKRKLRRIFKEVLLEQQLQEISDK